MKKLFLTIIGMALFIIMVTLVINLNGQNKSVRLKAETNKNISNKKSTNNNSMLEKKLKGTNFSGSVIIVKNGKTIDSYTRGEKNRSTHANNTDSTSFEINSLQKSLTAGLVMEQVKKGKIKLTDKVSKFFPELPGSNEIMIRNLLDMTSGLSMKSLKLTGDSISSKALLNVITHKVIFNPEKLGVWNYQPVNFVILAEIIEKVTGQKYEKLFKDMYINRLGLNETEMAYRDYKSAKKASGYIVRNEDGNLKYSLQTPNGATIFSELGTGQVYMSVTDFYKALSGLLDGKLLNEKNKNELFKSNVENKARYYSGLYTSKNNTYKYANGYGSGFENHVRISLDGKTAVVMFSNNRYVKNDGLAKKFNEIADEFLK